MKQQIDYSDDDGMAYWSGVFCCSSADLIEASLRLGSREVGAIGGYLADRDGAGAVSAAAIDYWRGQAMDCTDPSRPHAIDPAPPHVLGKALNDAIDCASRMVPLLVESHGGD